MPGGNRVAMLSHSQWRSAARRQQCTALTPHELKDPYRLYRAIGQVRSQRDPSQLIHESLAGVAQVADDWQASVVRSSCQSSTTRLTPGPGTAGMFLGLYDFRAEVSRM